MRNFFIATIALMILSTNAFAQKETKLPSANIKTLDGTTINTRDLNNDGKPFVISFWATWCKPCKLELDNIAAVYPDWQEELGVKLYAVSIDDSRSMRRVAPTVSGKGWEYEVLLDSNMDFKRAMNVVNVPHTFVVDGKGNIVYQHSGYTVGDEDELFEILTKVAKGEKIKH
ncbi:MAG: peroxiredoxin family protein [Hyphomicrobiales bacterium]